MYTIDLAGAAYRDKVMGCWMGKNCGGTLGTPIEEAWGKEELFDIWWYPELQEGGLPNDDLEMQLVWLEALRESGPGLTAADMAQAWLDHIGYNWDEYGLNKTNLRLGLQPPVSGAWNNWFVDCMGCPIRSEVWACLAPGMPRIAAQYAYHDGICDHAGGESVFGELFNVAIQSAAFVISDADTLLDIGLSYVPEGTKTRAAVLAARQAYGDGLDWKQARANVLEAAPSPIAQYSPVNMGFQVIGLLYGTDFGDAMCKTVNCGYDTDSSGGSIGSWLGIRAGLASLPSKWTEPFGLAISTNESWGGVRHLSDGSRPIPRDITEFTDQVIALAPGVLRHHGVSIDHTTITVDEHSLYADESIRELWARSPWQVRYPDPGVDMIVDYRGGAAARPGEHKDVTLGLVNHHPDPVSVRVSIQTPTGWPELDGHEVEIDADASVELPLQIAIPDRAAVDVTNVVRVTADAARRPYGTAVPIALQGAQAWRVYADPPPESLAALVDRSEPSPSWTELTVDANALPLAQLFADRDEVLLQHFLHSDTAREVRLGVDCTVTTTAWLNGDRFIDAAGPRQIRPSYAAGVDVALQAGWNELIVRLRRDSGAVPEGHTMLSTADQLRHGLVDVGRTRFPWD